MLLRYLVILLEHCFIQIIYFILIFFMIIHPVLWFIIFALLTNDLNSLKHFFKWRCFNLLTHWVWAQVCVICLHFILTSKFSIFTRLLSLFKFLLCWPCLLSTKESWVVFNWWRISLSWAYLLYNTIFIISILTYTSTYIIHWTFSWILFTLNNTLCLWCRHDLLFLLIANFHWAWILSYFNSLYFEC